jgi:hypothetical protein
MATKTKQQQLKQQQQKRYQKQERRIQVNSMKQNPSQHLIAAQIEKNFQNFYAARTFVSVLKSESQWPVC